MARTDGLIIRIAAGAIIVVAISAQDLVDALPGGPRPEYTPRSQSAWEADDGNAVANRQRPAPACDAPADPEIAAAERAAAATFLHGRRPGGELAVAVSSGGTPPMAHDGAGPNGAGADIASLWRIAERPLAAAGDGQ